MITKVFLPITVLGVLLTLQADAQSPTDLRAFQGLAPQTTLLNTDAGKAALGANLTVTGGIQTGTFRLPLLLPFAEQQQQALRDVWITSQNAAQLADGLGTTLGAAYVARAHSLDRDKGTDISPAVAAVLAYAYSTSGEHSKACKYFFANGTSEGKTPVSADAKKILTDIKGTPDAFGRAYGFPAGSPGADPFGDSRPFQTEPEFLRFSGTDYFNSPADNTVYNRGPMMDLTKSPSYPSGHTTYGYTDSIMLAILVPERYPEMVTRGAEYGNDRILVGAHYAMDVMGGRALALYDMAHLLANDPAYVNQSPWGVTPIKDFQAAVKQARADLSGVLQAACGNPIEKCAREDTGRFSDAGSNTAFYTATQTYSLPVVYPQFAGVLEDVSKVAPEAGYLLTVAYPSLTLPEADKILTETEGPGGGFLDDGSGFGVYSRINLYAASMRARQLTTGK